VGVTLARDGDTDAARAKAKRVCGAIEISL
jgi:hypothetical protein